MNFRLSRRRFLAVAGRVPVYLAALWSGAGVWLSRAVAGSPALDDHQAATLTRMAWLLFPYPELGMEPYQRVTEGMRAGMAGQEAMVAEGVRALDEAGEGAWLDRPESAQIEALKGIESGPFFQWVLNSTKRILFNDREVWAFVGYEGSSLEFGGYLDRGVNDIDWLD